LGNQIVEISLVGVEQACETGVGCCVRNKLITASHAIILLLAAHEGVVAASLPGVVESLSEHLALGVLAAHVASCPVLIAEQAIASGWRVQRLRAKGIERLTDSETEAGRRLVAAVHHRER
jgi:hypothetical protein